MREYSSAFTDRTMSRRGFFRNMALASAGASLAEMLMVSRNAFARNVSEKGQENSRAVTGTGGELLVAQMRASGVDYVFGNPGSTETGFYDALAGTSSPKLIMGLHEGIVASMAHGYNQVSGRPGVVNVHAVVGTAQMAGQLYNAHRDNAGLVVTAGMVDHSIWGDDVALAARPGYSPIDINRQFTKMSWVVRQSESIPMAFRRAVRLATTEPAGPVYLALADYALEAKKITTAIVDQTRFMTCAQTRPDPDQIEQLARWLIEARHPMLVAGPELQQSQAVTEAVELADLLGLPVTDLTGHFNQGSGFPTDHPLFYSRCGLSWNNGSALKKTDLFLGLGPSQFFPDGPSGPIPLSIPSTAIMTVIGQDAAAMGRTRSLEMALVSSLKAGLQDLIDCVRSLATPERLERLRVSRYASVAGDVTRFRQAITRRVEGHYGLSPMHPEEVAMRIERHLDRDAITVHENFSHDAQNLSGSLLRYGGSGKRRIANSGYSLGWGVGAATGARLAEPERQVALHIGDGAVMFSAAGFWTMARYQIPVLTLIWNNENYQTVRQNFARYEGNMADEDQYPGMFLGSPSIDFVQLVNSQGVPGTRATTADELERALDFGTAAVREGRPYVIEIPVQRVGPGAASTWREPYPFSAS